MFEFTVREFYSHENAVILFVFALVPGLPTLSLGFISLLFLSMGYVMKEVKEGKINLTAKTQSTSLAQGEEEGQAAPKPPKKSEEEIAREEEAKINDILKLEISVNFCLPTQQASRV